jgi:hypothetical protein
MNERARFWARLGAGAGLRPWQSFLEDLNRLPAFTAAGSDSLVTDGARMSLTITQREVRGVIILDLEGRLVMEDGVSQLVST